jgi:hypothetical protein
MRPVEDVEEGPSWIKTFEMVMGTLSVLCVLAVLGVVALHLGFRGECQTLRVC